MIYDDAMAEQLSGSIERVTFYNEQNGFAVLRVKARSHRELVTVVGHLPSAQAGEFVEASGTWVQDRDHGLQFKAEDLRSIQPQTIEGIVKFLGSGLIRGIGPHYAQKIVDAFGERTLKVIDESPAFLREIKGIGPRRIERIRQSWQEQKAVRNIIIFLQSHGVGTARAVRIYKTYGDQALELVRQNPYRLATDIWGVGFKTADELAGRLGIDRKSPLRARAALRFVLQELSHDGHVGYPEEGVLQKTAELTQIDRTILVEAVEHEQQSTAIVRDVSGQEPWLYLQKLHAAEVAVAEMIHHLRQGWHPMPSIDGPAALRWVERKIGIELAQSQRDAVLQAVRQKVMVITGGPGVGKTTIVKAILEIYSAKGLRTGLCAPTGRAAKRLSESTGREAKTIHRLLELDPADGEFKHNAEYPLALELLVVDEASMLDIVLMCHLVSALPESCCLLLVGDVDQLPSVGPGTVLGDLIASRTVGVARLTEIFRQARQSWIVRAAHAVHHGEMPESAPAGQGDFYFIEADQPAAIIEKMLTMVKERIPSKFRMDPLRDVQILTPMNRTDLGARNLNERLQEALNPKTSGPEIQRHGWTFRVGDKVLQVVNNYTKNAFNGDIGRVSAISMVDQELTVDYDGKPVVYDFGELDELALAYAMTIHKSQGSEYPAVIIPLHTQHFVMLQRNLLYTGITRGKRLVLLIGSRKALSMAVQRQDARQRYSRLRQRLQKKA